VKLNDIDTMNSWRQEYFKRINEVKTIKATTPGVVTFGGIHIKDGDILREVQQSVLPLVQAKLDLAKTKLMMLGFDEFPE